MIEHAILEVACERKAFSLKNLVNKNEHKSGVYCALVGQYEITVDEFPFIPLRNFDMAMAKPHLQQPHHDDLTPQLSLTSPMQSTGPSPAAALMGHPAPHPQFIHAPHPSIVLASP